MNQLYTRLDVITGRLYPYRLPLISLVFILNIFIYDQCHLHQAVYWGLLAFGTICLFILCRISTRLIWISFLIIFAASGGLVAAKTYSRWASRKHGNLQNVTLMGEITYDSSLIPEVGGWIIETDENPELGIAEGERLKINFTGNLLEKGVFPEWGDQVQARGDLIRFKDRSSGIDGMVRCSELVIKSRPGNPIKSIVNGFRKSIYSFCANEMGGENEGKLISGILLGDYRQLNMGEYDALRRTGLIHICSASGLHLTILAGLIIFLGKKLRMSSRSLFLFQFLTISSYVIVTGGKPAVIRSAFVATLLSLSAIFFLDFHGLSALGLGAVIMLGWKPYWLYNIGFQLSFLSILGLMFLHRPVMETFKMKTSKINTLLSATISVQLATAPLLLSSFGEISLVAPLANLMVLPVIPVVMACGFIGVILKHLRLPLAVLPGFAGRICLKYVLAIATTFSYPNWTVFSFQPRNLNVFVVIAYYLSLWAAFAWKKGRRLGLDKFLLIGIALILILSHIPVKLNPGMGGLKARIVFFDVGQGDSILVQSSSGENILIDGGEDAQLMRGKLREYSIRNIDLMILSHPDKDHVAGLSGCLDECMVGAVMEVGLEGSSYYREWSEKVKSEGACRTIGRAGEVYSFPDLRVEVLSPDSLETGMASKNDQSLVLRISTDSFSLLLTGDIESEEENRLLDGQIDLKADILKVPHHGGFSSRSRDFFSQISPLIAVISVGRNNDYGHPSADTLESLRHVGAQIYRTDQSGDIIIEVEREGYVVKSKGTKK